MLIQWIIILLVLSPFSLFLSVFLPQIQWALAAFWILSLTLDIYSTHKFYLKNPRKFSQNERNKIFIFLTEKLGFRKASIAFPIIFEIPLLLFLAVFPLRILYSYMFPGSVNILACFAASLGVAATGHAQAASTNLHFKTRKGLSSEHATA